MVAPAVAPAVVVVAAVLGAVLSAAAELEAGLSAAAVVAAGETAADPAAEDDDGAAALASAAVLVVAGAFWTAGVPPHAAISIDAITRTQTRPAIVEWNFCFLTLDSFVSAASLRVIHRPMPLFRGFPSGQG